MKPISSGLFGLTSVLALAMAPAVNADNSRSVRHEIRSLQIQIDRLRSELAQLTPPQFQIVFRDAQRTVELAPGATEVFALGCKDGEVVVNGGYNSNPSEITQIVLNGAFFDGIHSGWRVDFYNPSDATVTVDLRIGVGCTKGTGRGE